MKLEIVAFGKQAGLKVEAEPRLSGENQKRGDAKFEEMEIDQKALTKATIDVVTVDILSKKMVSNSSKTNLAGAKRAEKDKAEKYREEIKKGLVLKAIAFESGGAIGIQAKNFFNDVVSNAHRLKDSKLIWIIQEILACEDEHLLFPRFKRLLPSESGSNEGLQKGKFGGRNSYDNFDPEHKLSGAEFVF